MARSGAVVTVTQLTLGEPQDARISDPPTSHAAARRTVESRSKHRELALRVLRENPEGLTDFELAEKTGVQQTSIGKRRKDLERQGLVVATDKRRP